MSFAATEDAACSTAIINGGNAIQFYHPSFTAQLPTDGGSYPVPGGQGGGIRVCHFSATPTLAQTETCNIATTEVIGTNYASVYVTATDTSCIFSYEIAAGINARSAPAVVAPAAVAVPIFSPFGLLALLSGLFLYGKRRKNS